MEAYPRNFEVFTPEPTEVVQKMEDRVVLPTEVRPSRYRLRLEPDLEQFEFDGEETEYE